MVPETKEDFISVSENERYSRPYMYSIKLAYYPTFTIIRVHRKKTLAPEEPVFTNNEVQSKSNKVIIFF